MSLQMAMLAAHVPSICHEEKAPEFQRELIKGLHTMKERIQELNTDVIILISCHFAATFHHYVDVTPQHKGVLTAFECPDLISDVPYHYPGEKQLGMQLVEAGKKAGLPVVAVNDPTYVWDYGTVVPLRYLDPEGKMAVINLSVCLASTLDETYLWGQEMGKVVRQSGKRVVFVSSGALSHNLVRGRERTPTRSEQAMDNQFIKYLMTAQYTAAREMLLQYSRIAGVESGGRHLAALLGMLDDNQKAEIWGCGQSSGSGNAVISFTV